LLLAGSYGKTGAAVLAAKACLRSGVGLLSVAIPESSYQILQVAAPEAMVIPDSSTKHLSQLPPNLKNTLLLV
jgi:NAD(P)H-hydrate repair Nnr-like enzyme with NAD(P)H-hydrate dehydratase domain